MFSLQVLTLLCIGSVTLAMAGIVNIDTLENVENVVEEEEIKHNEVSLVMCKSYDRMIAPKIAQNKKGKHYFEENITTVMSR